MLFTPILFILLDSARCLGLKQGSRYEYPEGRQQQQQQQQQQHDDKCDRISVALCHDAPYNYTRMPNMLGHYDQQLVSAMVQEYKPLIDVQCSEYLKFFLCSVFTPMCTENVDTTITSCRSVCEEVKRSCLPLLKNFGFSWPDILNCSQFPPKAPGALCMDPIPEAGSRYKTEEKERTGHPTGPADRADRCPSEFMDLIYTEPSKRCGLRCDREWMFGRDEKELAEWWMVGWSVACVLVTSFTLITFCLDTTRFKYPERSIVFLSICYNLYAWGYLLRCIFGPVQSSCQQWKQDTAFLIVGGLDNPKCVIVFMILYYFGTASAIWWVVLTLTWYLAAAKKWGQEAIANVSSYFHLAAWGVPALLTIAVLITHQVDASELTSLCFVGQQDSRAMLGFVVAPSALFLIAGVGFIAAGFAAMVRIRREMRNRVQDASDVNKLEKLMMKIGIFSTLYVLPALTVIGCSVYEKWMMDEWSQSAYVSFCSVDGGPSESCLNAWLQLHSRPNVDVYILKIFMILIVGITSGMWVWSKKTFGTWRRRIPPCPLFTGPTGAKPQSAAVGVPLLAGHHPTVPTGPPYAMTTVPSAAYTTPSSEASARL